MKIQKISFLIGFLFAGAALAASSASDQQLEAVVTLSYNYRVILQNHVKVRANDGVVTLSGTVPDPESKELAVDTAAGFPGVVSVVNEIAVTPTDAPHSDAWIANQIHNRLLVQAKVNAADTTVVVTGGNVVLTGTADTQAQKDLTGVYANGVEGVKTVRNDIVVQARSPAASPSLSIDPGALSPFTTPMETIDDASINTQVKYALRHRKFTGAVTAHVTTAGAVVHLTGTALNAADKDLATQIVQTIRGVKSVINDITVAN